VGAWASPTPPHMPASLLAVAFFSSLLESLPPHDCRVCKGNVCYTEGVVEKMDLPLYLDRRPLIRWRSINSRPCRRRQ
jgi:hypothetical protein